MKEFLRKIKQDLKSQERREALTNCMSDKETHGVDCFSCNGTCCTFTSNSMMITPLEALELIIYLEDNDRLDDGLIEQLKNNSKDYRLDKELWVNNKLVRKTYTCPFFESPPKGCSISRWSKPYGCLAFNPNISDQKEGGDCSHQVGLLESREQQFSDLEVALSDEICQTLKINWEKKPIPTAILELVKLLKINV